MMRAQALEAHFAQEAFQGGLLLGAMFEDQPAAGAQSGWGRGDDPGQGVESFTSGGKCSVRFVDRIPGMQVRIGGGDVGWIGHDEIKMVFAEGRKPVGLDKVDSSGVVSVCIRAGEPERG